MYLRVHIGGTVDKLILDTKRHYGPFSGQVATAASSYLTSQLCTSNSEVALNSVVVWLHSEVFLLLCVFNT